MAIKKIAKKRIQIREALKTKQGKKLLALAKAVRGSTMDTKALNDLYAKMKEIAKTL